MKIMKIEITRFKLYFFLFFFIVSCQKDYYLDDLNDALSQVNSLRSEKSQLESQLNQLQTLINDSNNNYNTLQNSYNELQNSNNELKNSFNELQKSYDDLYESFINETNTVAELKDLVSELANEINALKYKNESIEDGYYISDTYFYKRNDSIYYDIGIEERHTWANQYMIAVKVEEGKIIRDYYVEPNKNYWDVDDLKPVKFVDNLYPKDYTYFDKFGTYDHINEYSGDSLPYYKNYRVYNKDIFTAHLRDQQDNSLYKQAFYKLFTTAEEIIGDIVYEPVVQFREDSYFNDFVSFEEILNVYDYKSESELLSDSIYSQIKQDDPKSYLEAFKKDAEIYGVDLSDIDVDELITDFWYTPTDQYGRSNVAGWGEVNCSITNNNIGLSDPVFSSYFVTDLSWWKLTLMYHEFGHAVLNMKHTCADGHIMSASSSCEGEDITEYAPGRDTNSLAGFRKAVEEMFTGYNQYYYPCTAGFSSRPN